MGLDRYLGRVTNFHRNRPRFIASLTAVLQPLVDLQTFEGTIAEAFDLDSAVGVQLDIVGQWVGRTRNVSVPIANAYFSFDILGLGFDQGVWMGPYDQSYGITSLDDDTYRRLLRAKILSNNWDGTTTGAQAAFDAFFQDPATFVFIEDRGQVAEPPSYFSLDDPARGLDVGQWFVAGAPVPNMSAVDMVMSIDIAGKIPSVIDRAILIQRLIPIKPEGVRVDVILTSVDGAALFGFDINNQYVSGFDSGAWGVSV